MHNLRLFQSFRPPDSHGVGSFWDVDPKIHGFSWGPRVLGCGLLKPVLALDNSKCWQPSIAQLADLVNASTREGSWADALVC